MRRVVGAAMIVGAILAAVPGFAGAQGLGRCDGEDSARLRCGTVTVPLDRTGAVAGTVRLGVTQQRARRPSGRAIYALAGGPGQAAQPLAESFAEEVAPALGTEDLVVFDQRGTGESGALRCRSLGRGALLSQVARCAAELGPRRAFYRTPDTVADIEAVRQRLGHEQITLYGTSYGTKVALAYAVAHPDRVARLVLDSVVALDGPDPLGRSTFQAMPRVLEALCPAACQADLGGNATTDLAGLVAQIAQGGVSGPFVAADGRAVQRPLLRTALYRLLLAGDAEPALRAPVPSLLRSAASGDPAPALRTLATSAVGAQTPTDEAPKTFSAALLIATLCSDVPWPWDRAATPADRAGQAKTALTALAPGALGPFDVPTAQAQGALCLGWPEAGEQAPRFEGPLPDVPVLLLEGAADLRTPREDAVATAARFPRATLVTVEGVGHSVVGSDETGCADRALGRFLRDRPVAPCTKPAELPPLTPLAPLSLDDIPAPRGLPPAIGRTAVAANSTLGAVTSDLLGIVFVAALSGRSLEITEGGLRAGRKSVFADLSGESLGFGLRLRGYEFVPGVRIDGTLSARFSLTGEAENVRVGGTLRVSGPGVPRGRLRLDRKDRLDGVIGGRRVNLESAALELKSPSPGRPVPPTPFELAARLDPAVAGGVSRPR